MRREDRRVINRNELEDIIKSSKVCRVAMNDEDGIYILPVNFGYTFTNDELEIFFHGAKVGKKVDILSKGNVHVGFEMDSGHESVAGEHACSYSFKYQSIIGKGYASIIVDKNEKIKAFNQFMHNQAGKSFDSTDKMLEDVLFFSIKATSYSGKRHN